MRILDSVLVRQNILTKMESAQWNHVTGESGAYDEWHVSEWVNGKVQKVVAWMPDSYSKNTLMRLGQPKVHIRSLCSLLTLVSHTYHAPWSNEDAYAEALYSHCTLVWLCCRIGLFSIVTARCILDICAHMF